MRCKSTSKSSCQQTIRRCARRISVSRRLHPKTFLPNVFDFPLITAGLNTTPMPMKNPTRSISSSSQLSMIRSIWLIKHDKSYPRWDVTTSAFGENSKRSDLSHRRTSRCLNHDLDEETQLLHNTSMDAVIIDFGQQSNLLQARKISCEFASVIDQSIGIVS